VNVALSRHVAALMQQEPLRALEFARRRELATAVDRVDDASELPEWMAQLIAEAEANAEEHDRMKASS
jgi:ABC-type molybdate transport system ATPase subunit